MLAQLHHACENDAHDGRACTKNKKHSKIPLCQTIFSNVIISLAIHTDCAASCKTMMMAEEEHHHGNEEEETFVYMGGDQEVPDGVRRARIHKDVKIVRARAFQHCDLLISVEFHEGVEIIEEFAFKCCDSLRGAIKLLGVKIVKECAFYLCYNMTDVEFGDNLETIEEGAFYNCEALEKMRMPSVRTIGKDAFGCCSKLTDVECGEGLRTMQYRAFSCCDSLERIALPLKGNMIEDGVFNYSAKLAAVDLVGGIHQTVASLSMESWRIEMNNEIDRINTVLPTIPISWLTEGIKTQVIQQWMESVINRLDHCKAEHQKLLKEATTLLELALWKANLDDNEGGQLEREGVRTTRGSRKRARWEICVTSGASIVIENVLPYLQLAE